MIVNTKDIWREAKQVYLEETRFITDLSTCNIGICYCLYKAVHKLHGIYSYELLREKLDFNPWTIIEMGFEVPSFHGYYWPLHDFKTRIQVFNHYIKHYPHKDIEI